MYSNAENLLLFFVFVWHIFICAACDKQLCFVFIPALTFIHKYSESVDLTDGHACMIIEQRLEPKWTEEDIVLQELVILEQAIECTGNNDKVDEDIMNNVDDGFCSAL